MKIPVRKIGGAQWPCAIATDETLPLLRAYYSFGDKQSLRVGSAVEVRPEHLTEDQSEMAAEVIEELERRAKEPQDDVW